MDAVNKLKTVKTIHARLIETVKWHKKELANRYSVECERLKKEQESLKSQIQTELEKLKKIRSNNGVNYQIEENEKKSVSVNKDKITTDKCTADKKKSKDTVKKQKNNNTGGATNVQKNDSPVDIGRLDLRVGKIISASNHPNADSLYVEIVDLGEEKPRNVVSGLVKYVPLEKMSDRMAVLLCNLKPSKIRGVVSEAMVMCASTPDKVEILEPPAGAVPGDIISVEGYMRSPDKVLKVFDQVAEDLKTNDANEATYKGIPWTITNKGIVVAQSLKNVKIK